MTRIFTIVSCNYLAEARVLMESVARHWPEAGRTVFVTDSPAGKFDPARENFEVVEATETALPRFRHMAFAYSPSEFCYVLKPYGARYLFDRHGADALVYLDADMVLFRRPVELEAMLERHSIVLSPHCLMADPGRPLHITQMKGGTFNAGFFAVRRSRQAADFLTWWGTQLTVPENIEMEWHNDQSWLNLVPGFFSETGILRHPGYNVAFWNLGERRVSPCETQQGSEAAWRVECGDSGEDLTLFHFSLYDPEYPEKLTGITDWARLGDGRTLEPLLRNYAARLKVAGYEECHCWPYGHGAFKDGKTITKEHRKFFKRRFFHGLPEKNNPFDPAMMPGGLGSLYNVDHPVARLARRLRGTD